MDFVSNQKPQIQEMLESIGIQSIEELFKEIPKELFSKPPYEDDGMSESEALNFMQRLGKKNTYAEYDSYLGAGAYSHYIPALISAITSRSEFLTSYTPYQPEVSQGYLQAIFEYQTALATLTRLDVSNASIYDGASAAAEAVLMALRIKKEKNTVLISKNIHPHYLSVIQLYLEGLNVNLVLGLETMSTNVACVLVQSPNFFGEIENMEAYAKTAHEYDALFIALGNPLSYALFSPPGEYGADIAVGDCQPFGMSLSYGGPYCGYMTTKNEYARQLPGRIVGQTLDANHKKGFVLTLQPREQHIRREKATSNLCTNQALNALSSLVTLMWYGPIGLKKLALTNYQRAHYLADQLKVSLEKPFFNEFVWHLPCLTEHALLHFKKEKIIPGLSLEKYFPDRKNQLLVAVTENKTEEQLSRFIEVAKQLC